MVEDIRSNEFVRWLQPDDEPTDPDGSSQGGLPQPVNTFGIPGIVLGGRRELREAAEPIQLTPVGRHLDPSRGPPCGGQVPGPPAERLQAGSGPLVAGIFKEVEQGRQTLFHCLER